MPQALSPVCGPPMWPVARQVALPQKYSALPEPACAVLPCAPVVSCTTWSITGLGVGAGLGVAEIVLRQRQCRCAADEQNRGGGAEGQPVGMQGFVAPAAKPGADHAGGLLQRVGDAVEHAEQAHAVNVGENGRGNGHGAGPDQAADGGDGVELPAADSQQQADEG